MKRLILVGSLLGLVLGLWVWPLPSAGEPNKRWFFYDRSGALLYKEDLVGGKGGRTTDFFRESIIVLEDKNFYKHKGVDLKAVGRAVWQNLESDIRVSGASTISMQLARLQFLNTQEHDWWYKIRQAFWALKLEQHFGKDELLTAYLQHINFGSGAIGVEAAAQRYFSKTPEQLSVLEVVALLAIVPNPTEFNPLNHPKLSSQRRQLVLDRLRAAGLLTAESHAFWQQQSLKLQPSDRKEITAPHFVFWLKEKLSKVPLAAEEVHVYTTLDKTEYLAALKILRSNLERLGEAKHLTNGAVVVLDRQNQIRVLLGSANFFDATIDGAVNMSLASRQTGSVLKPFLFALALDLGWSPLDGLTDLKTIFPSGYLPRNFEVSQENGVVRFREALANSYNIAAVDLLQQVGVGPFYGFLQKLELSLSETAQTYGLSLILGSAETSLLALTQGYSVFTHQGNLLEAQAIKRVEDGEKRILWKPGNTPPKAVLGQDSAEWGQQVLSDNVARWKNFSRGNSLELPFPSGAKTGTSQGFRDNWVLGFSPDYTVGVWVGNTDGTPMQASSGMQGAGPVWQGVMQHLQGRLPPKKFSYKGTRQLKKVCRRPETEICSETVNVFSLENETERKVFSANQNLALTIFYPRSGDVFAVGSEVLLQWRGDGESDLAHFKLDGRPVSGPIFSNLSPGKHILTLEIEGGIDEVEIYVRPL